MRATRKLLLILSTIILSGSAFLAGLPGKPAEIQAAPDALVPVAYLPMVMNKPPDLYVSRVEVVQGITMSDAYTVHIANRPTIVRVFAGLAGPDSVSNVTARLTRYVGGVAQASPLTAGPMTVYTNTSEGTYSHTFNFNLPANWLTVGTSYVVELDINNTVSEISEGNNRYPASGAQSFDFVNVDALDIVLVPIAYTYNGVTYRPDTSRTNYLSWLNLELFPVHQINYTWRSEFAWNQMGDQPVLKDGTGWSALLNAVTSLHSSEDPANSKIYYGVINTYSAHGCSGGCVSGMGWIGWPTAIGFAGFPSTNPGGTDIAGETMTHELGHNFGRYHVNGGCGESGTDSGYPYASGYIGQWGLDVSPVSLYSPSVYKDYMSYCGYTWTSDYTYKKIYDYRTSHNFDMQALSPAQDTLYLGGYFSADGTSHFNPLYRQTGQVGDLSSGTHRLDLLAADGSLIASHRFTPVEMADAPVPTWGVNLSFPVVEGLSGLRVFDGQERLLFERSASSPDLAVPALDSLPAAPQADGSLSLGFSAVPSPDVLYRVRFSPDGGQTWTVLALEQPTSDVTVPAELLAGAAQPVLEVQAVDGINTATQTFDLGK
jgi:hypothetical protein